MAATAQPIKSIDVGSMFLMDLVLNDEVEFNSLAPNTSSTSFSTPATITTSTTSQRASLDAAVQGTLFHNHHLQQQQQQDSCSGQFTRFKPLDDISQHDNHSAASDNGSLTGDQLEEADHDYIISYVHNQRGNYCRLLKNIQGCYLDADLNNGFWNQVNKQQQHHQPPSHNHTSNTNTGRERAGRSFSSSSSLSDLSLTASSDNGIDDSSSGSVISYSVINKYSAADDNGQTSSTTRDEDSGIVGMKHLDYQQANHSNSFEIDDEYFQQHQHQRFYNKVEPSLEVEEDTMVIMMGIEPTSESAQIHLNDSSYNERDNNKPTNNSHYRNNYSSRRTDDCRRSMSASLPIQVPARQSDQDFKSSCEAAEASDFEEFLDQEYDRSSHYY